MADGVGHRLPDGDADPLQRFVVESGLTAKVIADGLDEIEHVDVAPEIQADGVPVMHRAGL